MAAAYHTAEEEVWKCPKHPSKRRRATNGICPTCLRDRLVSLCPLCANVRPCACLSTTTASSFSSSSSSCSSDRSSFRRSRSVAATFLRSRNTVHNSDTGGAKTPSFLSIFKRSKTKRNENLSFVNGVNGVGNVNSEKENLDCDHRIEDFARMITRSRSVSTTTAAIASGFRRDDVRSSPSKAKFWHFPSPMKVFRSSKTPKIVVLDRSPLHRG